MDQMTAVLIILLIIIVIMLAVIMLNSKKDRPGSAATDLGALMQTILHQQDQILAIRDQLSVLPQSLTEGQAKNLNELITQMNSMRDSVNSQLVGSQTNIGQQLETSNKAITEVHSKLAELGEAAKQIHEVGKDIGKLNDILQAPKLRGNLGELFLGELLGQMLPTELYELQYKFKSGESVDAIVKLGGNIVPVDSKFPLESFSRMQSAENDADKKQAKKEFISSVKARITEIADKYIKPEENTYDFAMMYIPAENVFYEIIARNENDEMQNEILSYAWERHVIPVSPNSFYAYLKSVAYGLKGLQIEKQAAEIRGRLGDVQSEFAKFFKEFNGIGNNIRIAHEKHQTAGRRAEKIGAKISSITEQPLELEIEDDFILGSDSNSGLGSDSDADPGQIKEQ